VLTEHDQDHDHERDRPQQGTGAVGRTLTLPEVLQAETWARSRANEIIMAVATSSDREGSTAWT
jgi:hypothetical protein